MVTDTALGSTTPVPTDRPGSPPRWVSGALALVAFVGAAAIGVARGFMPYDSVDDPGMIVVKVLADPVGQTVLLWAGWVAALTLPVGVLLAGAAAFRERPVLGGIAAVVAWIGFGSLFAGGSTDAVVPAAATVGLPPGLITQLGLAVEDTPPGFVVGLIFVVGHILGAVLLGVALWRLVPRWAAVLLIASQPLHFVVAVVVVNHPLDALAWTATGVGLAAAVWALPRAGRTPGQEA